MRSEDRLNAAIESYYSQGLEEDRLGEGAFLLEGLRTRELIERHVAAAPARVLDIGGAAGAYALWLADKGYEVHLVDVTPRLVEEAERRSRAAVRGLASCRVGDARSLPFEDGVADVVLLLGPLYHLTDAQDRRRALEEAARVLRPGGLLFAAAISRWGSALDGLARNLFADADFCAIVQRDMQDGQHRNETARLDYFTTAYFHRPEDLRGEVLECGLEMVGLFGIEGPGWMLPDIGERLRDARRREDLLRVARMLETEPSIVGASAHMFVVARKHV